MNNLNELDFKNEEIQEKISKFYLENYDNENFKNIYKIFNEYDTYRSSVEFIEDLINGKIFNEFDGNIYYFDETGDDEGIQVSKNYELIPFINGLEEILIEFLKEDDDNFII